MSVELTRADQFIYDRLSTDTALQLLIADRVFSDIAPEGTIYPFVQFQVQSPGNDLYAVGAARIWTTPLYLIRGIGLGRSYGGALAQIAQRIDELLHDVQADPVIASVRERAFRLAEENPTSKRHLGGFYRIYVR